MFGGVLSLFFVCVFFFGGRGCCCLKREEDKQILGAFIGRSTNKVTYIFQQTVSNRLDV